jgi:carbamoyl-phosphate synthase large subunit
MKKILINGVGGPTPRSFAIALKNYSRYDNYEFMGTDCNKYAVGLYQRDLFHKAFLIPKGTAPDYWRAIEGIIRKEKIDYVVVLPEVEVLEWARRAGISSLPCKTLIPDYAIASKLVDKAVMTELLDSSGLVPKSLTILRDELKDISKFEIPFPFWIRSAEGSSGVGSLEVNTLDELKNWININPGVKKFLASTFLPGRNLCCKMLYYNGQLLRGAVGERVYYIMSNVAPSGITGNTSFGRLLNDPDVFEVAKKAMDILFGKTGAEKHGFFTVDLKEDYRGNPKITEVNIRHIAFTQCFAAAGANFAEDTIRLLDNDPSFDTGFKLYEFEPGLIFLRDVDALPIFMRETELLSGER